MLSKSVTFGISCALILACSESSLAAPEKAESQQRAPADKFDLSHWNLTVPLDEDGNKRADTIKVKDLQTYAHPDFFYLNEDGHMVFASPNKAITTPNSTNSRSELRYMHRGKNTRIKTHSAANNFAVEARKDSNKFGSVGGKMEATLRVDHVAKNAKTPDKKSVYSVVVGQIHSIKYHDNPYSYGGDHLYFKAGAYNQCSPKVDPGFIYPSCAGTGDWEIDKANGDYVQVTFSRLHVSHTSSM